MSLTTLLTRSAVTLSLALGAVAVTPPAQAGPYDATVTSGPGVLYADCTDHPFNYAVTPPANNYSWNIDLVLQAPDGTSAGTVYISKGDPTSGVETKQFCASSSLPGTYTVTGTYTVSEPVQGDSFPKTTNTPVAPFTFDLRLAASQITAKASDKTPRLGQRVKVNVKVTDERPAGGFFGTSNAGVQLQRLKGTRWVGVSGTKEVTGSAGTVQLRFKHAWKGKTKFKVVADLGDLGKRSSSTFTLRTGR